MYKRLTVAQLQKLCNDRRIDCGQMRYKREYLQALQQYDATKNNNDDSVVTGTSAADVQQGYDHDSDIESVGADDDEVEVGPAGNLEDQPGGRGDNANDAVAILQLRLQVAREERLANEELRRAREDERLTQERAIEREAQRGVQSMGRLPGPGTIDYRDVKAFLPTMQENDDILTFMMAFERSLELNGVERNLWARLLPAQLNQKALKIFARLSLEESSDYDVAKRAILNGFKLNSDSYLKTFRTMRRNGQSTYKAFLANLREVAARYYDAKGINSFETLHNAFIMEAFLSSLSDNVRAFVDSKQPSSADQAAEYSDLYYHLSRIGKDNNGGVGNQAGRFGLGPMRNGAPQNGTQTFRPAAFNGPRYVGRPDTNAKGNKPPLINAGRGQGSQSQGSFSGNANRRQPFSRPDGRNGSNMYQTRGAYLARSNDCDAVHVDDMNGNLFCERDDDCVNSELHSVRPTVHANHCGNVDIDSGVRDETDVLIPIYLNDQETFGLRDTGAFVSLIVNQNLVPKSDIRYDKTVVCQSIFAEARKRLPTARVKISSPQFGTNETVNATAIVANLPADVPIIIGNKFFSNFPQFRDILTVRKSAVGTGKKIETKATDRDAETSPRRDVQGPRPTPVFAPNEFQKCDAETTPNSKCQQENAGNSPPSTLTEIEPHDQVKKGHQVIWHQATASSNSINNGEGGDEQPPTRLADADMVGNRGVDSGAGDVYGAEDRQASAAASANQTDKVYDTTANRSGCNNSFARQGKLNPALDMKSATGQKTANAVSCETDVKLITAPDAISDRAGEADRQEKQTYAVTTRSQARRGKLTDAVIDRDSEPREHYHGTRSNDRRSKSSPDERQPDRGRTQNAGESDPTQTAFGKLAAIDVSDLDDVRIRLERQERATAFATEQRTDKSLQFYWSLAERGSNVYKVINGLLYKRTKYDTGTMEDFALVVPNRFRKDLLTTSHDTAATGHMGIGKTKSRLMTYFYWPGISRDVANYVKHCRACQLTAPIRTQDRVPLQSLPVLNAPVMENLTIDIIGPTLRKTAKGNRYLLILVCNTSRYVQAYPLPNLKASTICNKLLHAFTLFGLPSRIFSDQMSSFKSELITAVCHKFGVDLKYSSAWHPSSHGLVERTIRTLEDMIRKFWNIHERDWDQLIDFLLFALRESKHDSTQFSPFELVMGKKFSGPHFLQRRSWENNGFAESDLKTTSAAKYMQELTRKMQMVRAAAVQNDNRARQKMKRIYDRNATERALKVDDEVLLLLPTTNKKLEWSWSGPYKVTEILPNNNYRIFLGHRYGVYHINSLRKFLSEKSDSDRPTMTVLTATDVDNESDCFGATFEPIAGPIKTSNVTQQVPADKAINQTARTQDAQPCGDGMVPLPDTDFVIGGNLTEQQRYEMIELLADFDDVFSDIPGKTDLITHKIRVTSDEPIWQPSYKIPDALRDKVEMELQRMLDAGIIKYDPETRYNNPLIVIKKPNDEIRLVNNFIELNKRTIPEKYEMSNPAEILSRVAGSRYVSKLDLNRFFGKSNWTPTANIYADFGLRSECFPTNA